MAAKYGPDIIPCCVAHDSKSETKTCRKCGVVYCSHYASITDVRYCANCISDFHVKETIIEKTVEHERPDGTITFSRKYQAKHIMLTGTDWLFNAALIETMSDQEIDETIEYHRANVGLMLGERESRKKERYEKLSRIKIVHSTNESQHDREKKAAKKTRVKETPIDQLAAALSQLAKSGMTTEQIISMLGGNK